MDRGLTSGPRLPRLLQHLLVLFILLTLQACKGCKVDYCSKMYEESLIKHKIEEPESSVDFCTVLRDFSKCIKLTGKTCRGDFIYHSTTTLVNKLSSDLNCSALIGYEKVMPQIIPTRPSNIPQLPVNKVPQYLPPPRSCAFMGKHKFRHCGLFGDPHLKTFDNEYQTCRVRGAWPLIDNPYLAVQVTNEPVIEGSPATVTTKVTIIIKGRSTPCATEKTYEATADQFLPASFIDGTHMSGPNETVVLKMYDVDAEHQRVEIYVRYIETLLIVRQVGKYLAFSARLPEEIVAISGENLQLCDRGCPLSERLDLSASRGNALPWEEAVEKCQQLEGLSNEIRNSLTDHYLDWCVFDLMMTGDQTSNYFTAAAHSAQADVLRLNPESLKNRSETLIPPYYYNNHSPSVSSQCCVLRIFLTLFIILCSLSQ